MNLKKKLIALTLILVSVFTYSQEIKFGVKGGLNVANTWVNYTDFKTFSSGKGQIGVFLDIPVKSSIHIQFETQYSREGNNDFYIDFINIPLLMKFYIKKSDFYLSTGPQMGLILSLNGSNNIKPFKTNFAFNLGLGYEFDNGILVDIRYTNGIKYIFDEDINISAPWFSELILTDFRALTQVFQMSIGYKFD